MQALAYVIVTISVAHSVQRSTHMKTLIVLFALLIPKTVTAETRFVTGAATMHLVGTHARETEHFKNKWSKDGRLIGSPILAVERYWPHDGGYASSKFFGGLNSVGQGLGGAAVSAGMEGRHSRLGMVVGLYSTDLRVLMDREINPPGLPLKRNWLIQPIFGPEFSYGSAVKWHVILTPALAMSYFSVSF